MIEQKKKKKKISYKQKISRSIMWSALGIAIYTTAIALPISLINVQVEKVTFSISYDNLIKIRNYIIDEYGTNSSTNPLTFSELKQKCENGEIKKWIIDNFSDFFVQLQEEDTKRMQKNVDFKLDAEKINDSILITMSKFSNTTIKVDNLENEDPNSVYIQNNNIVFKFNIDDFVETKKLDYTGFNQFKTNLITQMQINKITFEDLMSNFNIQVQEWLLKILNMSDLFTSINIRKYSANSNFFSIELKGNSNYNFEWNNGYFNNIDYTLINNELTINFLNVYEISNDVLENLSKSLNNVIEQNNLDYYDIVDYLNNKNSVEYSSFKNFIFTELNKLLDYKLTNISILNDLILKNDNNQFSLEIIPNNNYFFLSNSNYFNNGKIIISNLQFSEYINFSSINFDDFYKNLQNLIAQNELTQVQFSSLFNENNFKDYVSKNLYKSNGDLLNFDAINTVTYDAVNNTITVTANNDAKFKLLAASNYNIKIDNGNIIISDLNFYTNIKFIKLDSLFNELNKTILDNNWSLDDFVGEVLNNPSSIIKIAAKNLFISNNDTITESDIKSITYLNNALNITLNPPANFNKYIAEDNKNISFSNNTFIIKNLSFVTNINFVKLDKLFDLFQNQISNNKYTIEQFKEWIANNTNINGDVANNLYISENETINSDLIENVEFNGVDSVIVTLKQSSLINYNIGKNDDISLVDNNIIITNFIYYSVTNVVNLSAVFDAIQAIINTNKFSIDDFEAYVKAADTNALLKDEIAKSLNLQNSTITIANIGSVEFKNNSVEITLIPGNNEKYSFEDYVNATYDDNKIIITNLDFYTIINFNNPNLIYQTIQNRIDDSQMSFNDFASDITNNQPLIKNIIADNLSTNLGNISVDRIGKVSLINNNLTIQINPLDYTKYTINNDNNVSLNNNVITIANLKYYQTINLINLDQLYNAIEKQIVDNKYNSTNYSNFVNSNQSAMKTLITDNLYISTNTTINPDLVKTISMQSSNQLVINLESDRLQYIAQQANNVTLNNYQLIITISYFDDEILISDTKLDTLESNIQSIIDQFQLSFDEFYSANYNFLELISYFLGINSSYIESLQIENNILKIIPISNKRFVSTPSDNSLIKNNTIQIEGLKYYEDLNITLSDVNNLKAALQSFIDGNNYNTIDFYSTMQEWINNDLDSLKNSVAIQLNISPSEVGKIEIKNFEIVVGAGNYKRFVLTDAESNLFLQNHRIHLSGFNCNGEIIIPEWRLLLLKWFIQDSIDKNNETPESWNKAMQNAFTGPLLLAVYSLMLDVDSSYIKAALAEDTTVTFAPADGITFVSSQITGEYIIDGHIVLNVEFLTGKISPDSYFTWNGNIITGLTAEGRNKKELILPARVTGIASGTIFYNNNLLTLDLSQTKITSLPDYNQNSGLISGCTQLNNVLLPDTLTTIGSYAFANSSSPNLKIRMPKSINAIGIGAFANLPTTIKIEIPLFDFRIKNLVKKSSSNIDDSYFLSYIS